MKITLNRLAVKDALLVGRRPLDPDSRTKRMPCVKGVHVRTTGGGVTFDRTDLGVFSTVSTDAEVHDDGEVLVQEKALREAVKRGEDEVSLVVEGDKLYVQNGAARLSVPTFDLDEWPELPKLDAPSTTFSQEAFDKLLRIASAAAPNDDRPVLAGVHFSGDGVAATDSYRLHYTDELPCTTEALVPAHLFQDAARSAKSCESYGVGIDDDRAEVNFQRHVGGANARSLDATYTGKLIEGTFPNWQALLPDEHEGDTVFPAQDMLDAVKALEPVTKQHSNTPVHFQTRSGVVTASFHQSEATSSVTGSAQGSLPESIAFNPSFLLDAVEAVGAEQVRMSLRDGLKPAILTDASGDGDVSALLMPMRTN